MASIAVAEVEPVGRVWLSEDFYERCYSAAIWATVMLCGVAVLLAFVDEQSAPEATITLAFLMAGLTIGLRGTRRYRWLRAHPNILIAVGPAIAVSALWPAVDENAIYFPALGVLALIACVGPGLRETVYVIGSAAAGTFVAALLDFRSPALGTSEQLATATLGVVICGALLAAIASWCAIWVMEEAEIEPAEQLQLPPTLKTDPVEEERPARAAEDATKHVALPIRAAEATARWLLAIRDLLGSARFKAASSRLTNFRARELQVLLLRAGGFDQTEIAGFLSIAVSTVHRYESSAAASRRKRVEAARKTGTASFETSKLRKLALTPAGIADELRARYPDEDAVSKLAERAAPSSETPDGSEDKQKLLEEALDDT
jgi:DNA-binding CsgD family transcriptional regulator